MFLRSLIFAFLCTGLNAAITITFDEIGNDVISSYSGTLNTNDPNIYDYSALGSGPNFNPSLGYFNSLPSGWRTPSGTYLIDQPSSGPFYDGPRLGSSGRGFGSGGNANPTDVSGDAFGIFQGSLVLPNDWTTGSEISGQMTWANTSLASLGIDTSQVHTWVLRGTEDTITMVVPEPSSYALLLGGIALWRATLRRRLIVFLKSNMLNN